LLIRWLPAPTHVAGLRLAHALRRRWWALGWRLGRRPVRGCRVLVFDAEDRVLLVRHSYGYRGWMLPGGGMAGGEDPEAAAAREVFEETGCRIEPALALGRAGDSTLVGLHEVHLVAGWTVDAPMADGREIVDAGFFALDRLPDPISPVFAGALPDYVTTAKAAHRDRRG